MRNPSVCLNSSAKHTTKILQSVLHSFARLKMRKRFSLTLTASHRHSEMIFTGCQCHIYRCLHQTASKYLQELCVPVTTTSRRHLHSSNSCSWWSTSSDNKNCHFRASQRVLSNFGTVYHPHPETRQWHLLVSQFVSLLKTHFVFFRLTRWRALCEWAF